MLFSDLAVVWNENQNFPNIDNAGPWDNINDFDGYKIYPNNNDQNLNQQDRLINPQVGCGHLE